MMDFPLVNIQESSVNNYKTSKEERFNVVNARGIQFKNQSLIGYSQIFNSGVQIIPASRTQLIIDGLGANSYSTETLWNPINNRINLQDANVNDYIDCQVFIPFTGAGFAITVLVEFDFSPALDGSQVITFPIGNSTVGAGNYEYNVKFNVTQAMKDNGIGIMVTPSTVITATGVKLVLENLPSQTAGQILM